MGRHKGVGMPRAKKQKLDAVRDRALEQVATADAESAGPLRRWSLSSRQLLCQLLERRGLPTS